MGRKILLQGADGSASTDSFLCFMLYFVLKMGIEMFCVETCKRGFMPSLYRLRHAFAVERYKPKNSESIEIERERC